MTHDEFIGQVQHRAELPSRGDAERLVRVTLETLAARLQHATAAHIAAQLPMEIGRHLRGTTHFEHLHLEQMFERIAVHTGTTMSKAAFQAQCVFDVLCEAISPGAVHKLRQQLPAEMQSLFEARALA